MIPAPNLNQNELASELKLKLTALECPRCLGPLGDVSKDSLITCPFCKAQFLVSILDQESKQDLSYKKLQVLSGIQVSNATLSSRMDIQYDETKYVDRPQVDTTFQQFLKEHSFKKRIFLLQNFKNTVCSSINMQRDIVA